MAFGAEVSEGVRLKKLRSDMAEQGQRPDPMRAFLDRNFFNLTPLTADGAYPVSFA